MNEHDTSDRPRHHLDDLYQNTIDTLIEYRSLLEKERDAIKARDTVKLEEYLRMDEGMIAELSALGACIKAGEADFAAQGIAGPGTDSVRASVHDGADPGEGLESAAGESERLRDELDSVRVRVRAIIAENRLLCESMMKSIQAERKNIKSKSSPPSPFKKIANPGIIDITR